MPYWGVYSQINQLYLHNGWWSPSSVWVLLPSPGCLSWTDGHWPRAGFCGQTQKHSPQLLCVSAAWVTHRTLLVSSLAVYTGVKGEGYALNLLHLVLISLSVNFTQSPPCLTYAHSTERVPDVSKSLVKHFSWGLNRTCWSLITPTSYCNLANSSFDVTFGSNLPVCVFYPEFPLGRVRRIKHGVLLSLVWLISIGFHPVAFLST